jgi:hypothetical protein
MNAKARLLLSLAANLGIKVATDGPARAKDEE